MYGIQTINENNELTFSDYGKIYSFVGKATLTALVQPSGSVINALYYGYSEYTFNYAGPIIVAIPLNKQSGRFGVISKTLSGSTWTIRVFNGDNTYYPSGTLECEKQIATEVFIFGYPLIMPSTYGIIINDDNGNICGNIGMSPLSYASILKFDGTNPIAVSTSIIKPLIIGTSGSYQRTNAAYPGRPGWYKQRTFEPAWALLDTNNLYMSTYQRSYFVEDGPGTTETVSNPTNAILVEGAYLS